MMERNIVRAGKYVMENDGREHSKTEQICDTDTDGREVSVAEQRCDTVMEGRRVWPNMALEG